MSADVIPTAVSVCEFICKSIVSDPDAVDIEVDGDDGRFELTVTVGDGDTGRVIGRRGRTAQAIRAVVRAAAAKDDAEVDVEFAD
ncbi:MAG: KH domain-containing protein [Acidimicrobiales bacterium]|nr:KH domain-containing protein [Acidimicrobiales bacterium]